MGRVVGCLCYNPKSIFLIDGIGAILSTLFLGVLLVQFESYIGMPSKTLYMLAFIPCLFMVYDIYCYIFVSKNWVSFVKIIAYANLGYCIFSIGMLWLHAQKLTYLGWGYFILEILIVFLIAIMELRVAKTGHHKKRE